MSHRRRLVLLAAIAVLPPTWKPRLYARLFGYRIHPSARIGVTILDAGEVDIAAGVTIGHGNLVLRVGRLSIGQRTRIGMLNVVRGGTHVDIGRYVDMLRRNELTSIVELDLAPGCEPDPCLRIGDGSVLTDGHRLDFTDRIDVGRRVILGGRGTSLWTHNRQLTAPIRIGDRTYIGSECRMAPGASLPEGSIVALGSVVSGQLTDGDSLIGGVPATRLRALHDNEHQLVTTKTRRDLPDDL